MRDEFLDPSIGRRRRRRRRSATRGELDIEAGLRPRALDEFIGQRELKEHLRDRARGGPQTRTRPSTTCCSPGLPGSARPRWPASSPPRWASTSTSRPGPALERAGDLAAILTKLEDGDVLFIDEIHRLSRAVEEILYPAMEDFQLDIVVGKGPAASSIRLTMPPFTLVGATTRTGMITGPLRDRFGLVARLDYYDAEELQAIVERAARILDVADRPRRRLGDRPPVAWHAAYREPAAAAGARLRRGSRRRHDRCRRRPRRARAVRRRRPGPRQGRPGDPHGAVHHSSTAARSGCRPWRSASASSPKRSRTCTSRS